MTWLGVDLGRRRDYATITVINDRLAEVPIARQPVTKRVLPLEIPALLTRFYDVVELGEMSEMPYPEVVRRIYAVANHPKVSQPYTLVVDATGVGIAVCDMMRSYPYRMSPVGITITGGHAVTQNEWGYNVPKKEIMTNMAVVGEFDRLRVSSRLALAGKFADQVKAIKVQVNSRGSEIFESDDRDGHYDLVMGAALALWYAEHIMPAQVELPQPQKGAVFNPATHRLR